MDILKSYFIGNYYTHSYIPCFQNFTVLINGDLKNKGPGFSMLYVIVFICGLRFEVRGDCSFC